MCRTSSIHLHLKSYFEASERRSKKKSTQHVATSQGRGLIPVELYTGTIRGFRQSRGGVCLCFTMGSDSEAKNVRTSKFKIAQGINLHKALVFPVVYGLMVWYDCFT